jgi:hypothetical protein
MASRKQATLLLIGHLTGFHYLVLPQRLQKNQKTLLFCHFSLPLRMCSIHRGLYLCWLRYVHSRAGPTEGEGQRSSAIDLLGHINVVFFLPNLFSITEKF